MEKWLVLAALVTPGLCLPTFGSFFGGSAAPPPPPPPPSPSKFFNPPPPPPPPQKFTPPAIDCVYGQWTQWSTCTAACGQTAFISRTRVVLKEASGYGAKCDPSKLEEWQECQGEPCPQNCQMGDWSQWTACNANCGPGSRTRQRQVLVPAANGGSQCGPLSEEEPCNSKPCPINCQMTPWSLWSQCSATCGEGRRQRLRSVEIPAAFGGLPCGPAEEWEACNERPCQQNCVLGDWSVWTACPSCGQASRSRQRSIILQGSNGGTVCQFTDLSETESCNNSPCPVNCEMEQWSAWSRCSSDCGSGRRARTRSIKVPAAFGGQPCGPAEEWEACSNGPCPVDCEMSEWSVFGQCSAPCDGGQRQRFRSILKQAQFGGQACEHVQEQEPCNTHGCQRDCVMGDWSVWTSCPSCGSASRNRQRSIITQAANGGVPCSNLFESEPCAISPCPINCEMEQWSAWSQCSSSCGEGRRQRLRSVRIPAQFGGRQCGPAEEWEACSNNPCPVNCKMTPWSLWSQCSATCGEGRRQRLRSIEIPASFGGLPCGPAEEWEACNLGGCQQDCVEGDWSVWTSCPTCGSASRNRQRSIVQQPANGGRSCGGLFETEQCNVPQCPVDCQVSQWGPWSACSAECGSGSRQRLRTILTPAANGGKSCPTLEDWQECTNQPCKVSVCDGIQGVQYFAEGCTASFILCSNGQEFPKVCPEPSRFDVISTTCKLPSEVSACAFASPPAPVAPQVFNPPPPPAPVAPQVFNPPPPPPPPAPPAPAPPAPKSFFSRAASFFSYDTPAEPTDSTIPTGLPKKVNEV